MTSLNEIKILLHQHGEGEKVSIPRKDLWVLVDIVQAALNHKNATTYGTIQGYRQMLDDALYQLDEALGPDEPTAEDLEAAYEEQKLLEQEIAEEEKADARREAALEDPDINF